METKQLYSNERRVVDVVVSASERFSGKTDSKKRRRAFPSAHEVGKNSRVVEGSAADLSLFLSLSPTHSLTLPSVASIR